jgi:excisionase family DNA binding protein
MPKKKMLTIAEVSEYLHLHPATIYRLLKSGDFPGVKIGDSWRIHPDLLEAWYRERTAARKKRKTRG